MEVMKKMQINTKFILKRILALIIGIITFVCFIQQPLIVGLIFFTIIMVIVGFRMLEIKAYVKVLEEKQDIIDEVKEKKEVVKIKIPHVNTGHGNKNIWHCDSFDEACKNIDILLGKRKY